MITPPDSSLIVFSGVRKAHGGVDPLRLDRLDVDPRGRVTLFGLERSAAEMVVHLITGAALPDEGTVRVAGRDTREIATDTEWLTSLDRFGIVTDRAVLLETLSIAANLALPLTLAIDPMTPETRAAVEALASDVGLPRARLDAPARSLTPEERARVHLARALAMGPEILLLEHPTAAFSDDDARREFGAALKAAADRRGSGWLLFSTDEAFADAAGGEIRRVKPASGELVPESAWAKMRARLGRSR